MTQPAITEPAIIRLPDGRLMTTNARCWQCKKKLGEKLSHPYEIVCPRCHARNCSPTEAQTMLPDGPHITVLTSEDETG